jgi:glycosyltransferase involved in cell wall biosynthesis
MVHPERFTVYNDYIMDEQRDELFDEASVVVLPYTDASQSGVIPVAYIHSKPVVATRVGSLPDLVDEGQTGLLIPPRDEHALADAIIRLLRDPDLAHQMGDAGRRKLDNESAPSVVAERTKAVYEHALHRRLSPLPAAT